MSKSKQNQRLIFKIHSSRFKYNSWDLKLSIDEARRNEELVSLGDSETLRMIRQIRENNITEEDINKIKINIKKLKKKKSNDKNKEKIKELYNELTKHTLIEDYIIIVFDTIDDWNKANSKNNPVIFNDKEYIRLLGTSGGIKNNSVVFVSKEIHSELDRRLNNGRDVNKKYVPAKFESYKALSCSCSTPVTQPKKVLVIKDGEVDIKADVLRLSDNGNGGFNLTEVNDYEIKRAFTDGCGMISPELSKQWTYDLTDGYYKDKDGNDVGSTGYNIRNSWTKGMVFTFPFVEYADTIGEYMVEDAWGDMVDIRKVDLIITTNMLKLWDSYNSCEHYLSCCKENGFQYSVAKILPEKLESVRNMNYQFLQSYELSDNDIEELIKPTVDMIKGAVGCKEEDYAKMLLFLKGNKISEKDFINEEFNYMKALMVNKEMMNDPFIKQRIHKMIKKKIEDSKKGVIQVNGNYQIVAGDLYALCQFMFKKKVTGLLKAEEFYSRTWLDKGVKKIVSYRAPMTIHNNIKLMNLIDNEETSKWYRYMTTCLVLNAWDTTMDAMNGEDMDGDANITTDNEVLIRNTIPLKTVVCEQKAVEKQKISETLLRKANKNGFGNDVGSITNRCTAMFDVLAKFKKGTKEYDEMMYRITCMQGYQQEIIDSCKGIIPKEVPKEWYDYKVAKDDEYLKNLLANKKPYFFIYNYKHVKNKYDKYIKTNNDNCLLRFGLTVEELIDLDDKNEEQLEFLKYYDELMPVSNNGSTINRICNRLEEEFDGLQTHVRKSEFDKSILMTDKKINKKIKDKLEELYKKYKENVYQFMSTSTKLSKEEKKSSRSVFVDSFIEEANEICSNEEELCNTLVDMLYDSPNSKQFVWDVCGDYIVEKLLNDNNGCINYPVLDDDGDIDWNGSKYSMINVKVGV